MQIKKTMVTKITVSDIPNLDPIAIYLEDTGEGMGKLTLTCFNDSWSYYWGSMGNNNLSSFILKCDNNYLSRKLMPEVHPNVPDDDNMEKYAKQHIIQRRIKNDLSKEKARSLYDRCFLLIEYKYSDTKEYANYMSAIFGGDWFDCYPTKINPDYEYFYRILDAVKKALKEITT